MPSQPSSRPVLFYVLATLLTLVKAQRGTPSTSYSPDAAGAGSYDITQTPGFKKSHRVLITHAILATLAWAFFAPLGAILLRVNIPGVSLLRLHVICQLFVYTLSIVATGIGIWLSIQASEYHNVWIDGHVVIGLIVFCGASIAPWLGWIHHIVFKNRMVKSRVDVKAKKPGRTTITILHIWIGRILILLGMVTAGLGIRLASTTPFQSHSTSRMAEIAYGVIAGVVFLLFAGISVHFEYRRAARLRAAGGTQVVGTKPQTSNVRELAAGPNSTTPVSITSSEDGLGAEEKAVEIGA